MSGHQPVGPNPVGLLFRHVLEERLRALLKPGARVLDLRPGALESPLFFGVAGFEVSVVDPGHAAIDIGPRRDLDGAYAGPGALDGVDLVTLGGALAAALRPGTPVLLCLRRPGLRQSRARLGPEFIWRGASALGLLVPGESRHEWVRAHPQAFGVLAALEGLVRRWPLLRGLGDYAAIEGARR